MHWTRGRTIGFGSSATVSLARSCDSGEVFAVKSATLSHSHSLQVEQQLLSALSCPHIVSYKGCDVSTENGDVYYNLFLEYAPSGTLPDEVRRRGGSLSESAVKLYARQVLLGMKYLHANGVVHCDIKGDNILVTENGRAKLADFGCARRVDDYDHGLPSISGTPLYMAPEAARGEEQGFAADVWALGCTVMEMATGRPPWGDVSDPVSCLYRIGFSGDVPEIPSSLSKQGSDFVSKCLKRDAWERWSASELLGHPFLVEEGNPNCWNSPTTVLDHGLWGDLEELDEVECGQRTYSKSAGERIRRLSEGNADKAAAIFGGVVLLSWDCDEDWVTVRYTTEEVDHVDDDEATNTYSSASTSSNALVLCNYCCNGSFGSRKVMCWPLEASTSKCSKNVFYVKPIFDNENFRFFNLSMIYFVEVSLVPT